MTQAKLESILADIDSAPDLAALRRLIAAAPDLTKALDAYGLEGELETELEESN